jgi:hypothetical protein
MAVYSIRTFFSARGAPALTKAATKILSEALALSPEKPR